MTTLQIQGAAARKAAYLLAEAAAEQKNRALLAMADMLEKRQEEWLSANKEDVAAAERENMSPSLLDRLTLTPERIRGITAGIREIAELPDPVGGIDSREVRPNGLVLCKKRVPLGVVGIIFEARPNVVVDAAALCLKSGNACILRGGKEAIRSNRAAVKLMREALEAAGIPGDSISLVQDTGRGSAEEMMHLDGYLDVLIPRGGAGLIRKVAQEASVPVIRTGEGVCHVYIDRDADLSMGAEILYNAKCSRPSVCNAAECVLIQKDVAADFLKLALPLLDKDHVELRCDNDALTLLGSRGVPAQESDWDAEYGNYTLAVRLVENMEEAIGFIRLHTTGHSECIVTENEAAAERFLNAIDAAAVYVNASTRFTDGGEFGLGAEIGISTQKLHARGPMGLRELTSYKYVVYGKGQVR